MKNYGSNHPFSCIYINDESFGERIPDNWEEIASAMNRRIDVIIDEANIADERDCSDYMQLLSITHQADELWQAMQEGTLPDVPRPVYSD